MGIKLIDPHAAGNNRKEKRRIFEYRFFNACLYSA